MPAKSTSKSPSAVAEHRRRLRSRCLKRIEVQFGGEDAPLVRAVAAALADPDHAGEARAMVRRRFGPELTYSLKDLLAAAPLEDIDLIRSAIPDVRSIYDLPRRHQRHLEIRKRPQCHPSVASCWAAVEDRDLFLSALTLGEIRKETESIRPRDPVKVGALERWLREVPDVFGDRIIGVDPAVADAWGRMSVSRSVPVIDALLAAKAQVHDFVFVTRNTADVSGLGVRTLNPFDKAPA